MHFGGRAFSRSHGAVQETGPFVGGLGAGPYDPVDGLAQPRSVGRPRTGRHRCGRTARREFLCAPTMIDVVDRVQRGISEEDAVSMIVNGFCKQVLRELPMEFAVEAQNLLGISLEGAVG